MHSEPQEIIILDTGASGTPVDYFTGIDWCRDYISMTLALNKYLEQGEMDQVDAIIEQRQGMLEKLPAMVQLESGSSTKASFLEMLEAIKNLEDRSTQILRTRMSNATQDIGSLNRYRRSISDTSQPAPVSRYIDTKR